MKARLGILISGRGSNMAALASACAGGAIDAEAALVISNVAGAAGLDEARRRGIETLVLDHRQPGGRAAHDARMAAALKERRVDLVCLAGYMRLLSASFVRELEGRVMNVHPSLLPAFPGLDAQRQALEHGVRVSGATVHYVDDRLDAGPIILQAAVAVEQDDTVESLSARILREEHRIYPEAVGLHVQGRLRIEGRRVRITGR
ncbi:MAG TPA: phosphoribosylglycinamide formyltransferase [Candidatus Polarisedimenticolia bacterium]|nr:phosphoribosylglycinamide formyltransferase [Candidatus Polarisedimenticolia bacterium]